MNNVGKSGKNCKECAKLLRKIYLCKRIDPKSCMKETLSTIAARTGCSITTVSRVLSGNSAKYRISAATRDKVLEEAARSSYRPSVVAQSLRTSKTHTVGLLLPSVSNPYFADMAQVAVSELRRAGYTTILIDTMEDARELSESVVSLVSRQVDGLIVVPCGTDATLLEQVEDNGVPVVLIDRQYGESKLSYVTTNNYQGGLEAVRYLISNGHRRIACIKGVLSSVPSQERVEGYRSAMKEAGLEEEEIIVGNDFSVQNGYLETRLLLSREQRPTAIFTLGNTIAMGAMRAIREAGLRIPEDISLMTFDNNMYLDFIEPVLTRIGQPVEDMAKIACKILLDKIHSSFTGYSRLRLAPVLIPGASVLKLVPSENAV